MTAIRLTAAQALVRAMTAQQTEIDGATVPLFAGACGRSSAMATWPASARRCMRVRDVLPTYRGQNEQGMALAAIAYAKASRRRRMMACTTSIGPGALNMVTAAAVAHVDRLPVLLLPGDVFATRRPDPVLQQIEEFGDGTLSANDCFRPVSRYFDRITRPEQVVPALRAGDAGADRPGRVRAGDAGVLPGRAGPGGRLSRRSFFAPRLWRRRAGAPGRSANWRRPPPCCARRSGRCMVAGGGVLYAEAEAALARFSAAHGLPAAETQAGKSSLPASHPMNMGGIGVTGTGAGERAGRRGRRDPRRGHPAAGFHLRLARAVRGRRAAHHRAQRAAFRRRQAWRRAAGGRRAGGAGGAGGGARRLAGARGLDRACATGESAWEEVAARYTAAEQHRPAVATRR